MRISSDFQINLCYNIFMDDNNDINVLQLFHFISLILNIIEDKV